jgi:hypothetical protein
LGQPGGDLGLFPPEPPDFRPIPFQGRQFARLALPGPALGPKGGQVAAPEQFRQAGLGPFQFPA